MTRQRLGQHFLAVSNWQRRIAETLPLRAGETWVEIGPGHGEMTSLLAGDGRRVVAIETDGRLAERLRERVGGDSHRDGGLAGVEVVRADVLQVDFAKVVGEAASSQFRVYGNLPYYITSPILHHLFRWADRILSIHIVVQFEVAARIVASPRRRDYGYLSVMCRFYAKPEIVLRIPPGAFRPPPRVTSALVKMMLPGERAALGIADEQRFLEFVQLCFSQKRKTLRNNLRSRASDDRIHAVLAACGLPADARAEQLTLSQFAALFKSLS